MAHDMKIIEQIEKQLEFELNPLPIKKIISDFINGYALDNDGQVQGLNLDHTKIEDISLLRDLGGLTLLSLRGNQITSLMPLSALKNLTRLSLISNQIMELTPLSTLTNLMSLSLHHNQITDLSPLSALTKLTYLYLNNNQITDLTPLSALKNLNELSLGSNQITDFTPLSALTNLTNLYLDNNQITDLMPLSALTNLAYLYLNNNQITDLTPLRSLTNLTNLILYNNQITDLSPLSILTNLPNLHLENNQITDLTPLRTLTNLIELYLHKNQITDLTPLSVLTNLTNLHLENNQITDLTPLRELKQLVYLDVSYNRIQQLPSEIISWWPRLEIRWENGYTRGLNLYDNPLTDPPIEIIKNGNAAIKNYFDEIERASVLFLESKLLLVGSGDVGKTSLMKKLKDHDFVVVPGKEDTTRGIDIQPWQISSPFPDGLSREVNIHFWDFGGQDILHATHQFFLTKRSLYLFVWDPRKEEETRGFDYWLNAVKLFGAGSPLIMVMNKADLRIKHIDEASFQDKFPNIARYHQVSCVTSQQILELTETIRMALSQMPHLLDRLPKRWMETRDALTALDLDYIPLIRYLSVCIAHGMNREKAMFLSDYLHDLGIILHFSRDPVLTDTVILKPGWATGAVYALIDSLEIQKNKGRFNRAHLGRWWDAQKYPEDKYPQLLRLIEKFELCFNIVGTDDYILPELLPTQRPPLDIEVYRFAGNLHFHYAYDFMPAGIITRFISRLHYLIREDHYWNNGVELEFSGSTALVVSDAAQKRIRVSVTGTNSPQLMGVIRSNLDHIHETINMKKNEHVFEEVPCHCPGCMSADKPFFYKYHTLQKFSSTGKTAITCEKSFKDVLVHQLLNGLQPPGEPGNLFDTLVTIASQVQCIGKTLQKDENSRNTVVALLLQTRGFRVKDQTLSGSAATGAGLGELDIKVEDQKGRPVSIIEAMKLDSCKTGVIESHILKLLRSYDCSGLKENYILVYGEAPDFEGFCKKYRAHLYHIEYESYSLLEEIEKVETGFNKVVAYRAHHRCNEGETVLNHILVEI